MPPSARIAVVERAQSGIAERLGVLPNRPDVRSFADLYEDFEAIRRFAPNLLLVDAEPLAQEDLGALRLAARAVPGLATILVAPREREVELAATAEVLGAQLLLRPFETADLAAVVAAATPGGPVTAPGTFLDVARGISDEINNPLLFAAGHLQLLEAMLDERADATPLAQLRAIKEGLDRIGTTMAKIRLLGEARSARGPRKPVALAELLRSAAADLLGGVTVAEGLESVPVLADERLLRAALEELVAVGHELASRADSVRLELDPADDNLRVRLLLRGLDVPDWQLPRAFEPYYLNRILRGTTRGLALFLVQTIVHAHGGLALARRCADGTVAMDLLLPRATPPAA